MVQKKSKGGKSKGSSGGGKPKEPKNARKPPPASTQLPPQDRVANIRPYWENLDSDARLKLLSVSLDILQEHAKEPRDLDKVDIHGNGYLAVPGDVNLPEVLDEGITRLKEKATWKVWQWMPDSVEFFDADSFRSYLQEKLISEDLRRLLPRDDGRPVEKPAEAALRQRMTDLLTRIQTHSRQYQEEPCGRQYRSRLGGRGLVDSGSIIIRDTNVEIITMILEALEREHEFVYQTMLLPITQFVCEVVPEDMRESTKTELYFEDLERMPPDDVVRIVEWLTEKVDAWGSKLKPEAKDQEEDDEEESMGDVDLFSLTEESDGLTVNSKWLQHLSERLLGEDGHPRKVQAGEDPNKMGLVLEWVYGSIVSTAEKARDSAKRALGSRQPTAEQAYAALMDALRDQSTWEDRARTAKELMTEMLKTRKEAAEYQKQFGLKPAVVPTTTSLGNGIASTGGTAAAAAALRSQHLQALTSMLEEPAPLPDEVIISMLRREVLLTRAKLHSLLFEHIMGEKQLRSLKAQLRQGEPEFDRLKRELEEVKHAPRGLDGTYRSAAEMERHRHQLADAAIEEQLEVQTAFREQGARLQQIYDRRQRTEQEIAKREQEISHLNGWKATVEKLLNQFEEMTSSKPADVGLDGAADPDAAADAPSVGTNCNGNGLQLSESGMARNSSANVALGFKLRNHFMKDVRKQLYTDEDDKLFFGWIQQELKQVEKRLEDGRAALQHLEMQLINVACDDPGAIIGTQLVLPILQDRLDQCAFKFHEEKAKAAESALISMEAEKAAREAAEKQKKAKQKQSKKGKTKTEAERKAAEKAAKEAAEAEKKAEDERRLLLQEEEHRRQLRERLEEIRKQEEEIMEKRRQELLSDTDGYWRQRMEEQRATQALLLDDRSGAYLEDQMSMRDTASSTDSTNLSSDDGFTPNVRQNRKLDKVCSKPQSPTSSSGERSVLKAMPNGFHQEHEHWLGQGQHHRRRHGTSPHNSNGRGPANRPAFQDTERPSRFQPVKPAHRDADFVQDNGSRQDKSGDVQAAEKGSTSPTANGMLPPPQASTLPSARMKGEVYVPVAGNQPGQQPGRQVVLIHAPEGMSGRRRSDATADPVPSEQKLSAQDAALAASKAIVEQQAAAEVPMAPSTPPPVELPPQQGTPAAVQLQQQLEQQPAVPVADSQQPPIMQPTPASSASAAAVVSAPATVTHPQTAKVVTASPGQTPNGKSALVASKPAVTSMIVQCPAGGISGTACSVASSMASGQASCSQSSMPVAVHSGTPVKAPHASTSAPALNGPPDAHAGGSAAMGGHPRTVHGKLPGQPAIHATVAPLPPAGAPPPAPPSSMPAPGQSHTPSVSLQGPMHAGVLHPPHPAQVLHGRIQPPPPPPPPPMQSQTSNGGLHHFSAHVAQQAASVHGPAPPHLQHVPQHAPPASHGTPATGPRSMDQPGLAPHRAPQQTSSSHPRHPAAPNQVPHTGKHSTGAHIQHHSNTTPPHHHHCPHDTAPSSRCGQHVGGPVPNKTAHTENPPLHAPPPASTPHPPIIPPHHTPLSPRVPLAVPSGGGHTPPQHAQGHPGHHRGSAGASARTSYTRYSSPVSTPVPHGPISNFNANSPAFNPSTYPIAYPSILPPNGAPNGAPPPPPAYPVGMAPVMPVPGLAIPQFGSMHPLPVPPPPPSNPSNQASGALGSNLGHHAPGPPSIGKSGVSTPAKTSTLRAAAQPFIPSNMRSLVAHQLQAPSSGPSLKKANEQGFPTARSVSSNHPHSRQSQVSGMHDKATSRPSTPPAHPPTPPPPPPPSTQHIQPQFAYHSHQPQQRPPSAHSSTRVAPVQPKPQPAEADQSPPLPPLAAQLDALKASPRPNAQVEQPTVKSVLEQHSTTAQRPSAISSTPSDTKMVTEEAASLSLLSGVTAPEPLADASSATESQSQAPIAPATPEASAPTQPQPSASAAAEPKPSSSALVASPSLAHQRIVSHAVSSPLSSPAVPSPTPPVRPLHSTPSWSSIAAKDGAKEGCAQAQTTLQTSGQQFTQANSAALTPASNQGPTAGVAVWRAPSDSWKTKLTQMGKATSVGASDNAARVRDAPGTGHLHRSAGSTGSLPNAAAPLSSHPVDVAAGKPAALGQTGKPVSRHFSLARSLHANDDPFLAVPSSHGGVAKPQEVGGVLFEGFTQDMRLLRLVKGLVNDDGSYNCFLNVIIQSLWHLHGFRESLLSSPSPSTGATPIADVKVYGALRSIFQKLSVRPCENAALPAAAAPTGDPNASLTSTPPQPSSPQKGQQGWVVDPVELREALSGLQQGQHTSVLIQLSEMHDASEVLGEVLNCLHRAEAGVSPDGASDVQLPKRVQVKKAQAAGAAAPPHPNCNGVHANGYGMPNHTGSGTGSSSLFSPQSLVHKVFGLDVQVPAPPSSDDEDESPAHGRRRKQHTQSAEDKPSKPKEPKDPSMVEVHQYMKYFHLVPAQGLRQAADTLFDGSPEDVVREADAADTLLQRLKSGTAGLPHMSLLRRPYVFTLAIVWESPQAPLDAIKGTIRSLACKLDLSQVFSGLSKGAPHLLRSVVCYFGHHYQAFVLSEEMNEWLLFDDTTIRQIGTWHAVQATMVQQRLQPSLLFYEYCR